MNSNCSSNCSCNSYIHDNESTNTKKCSVCMREGQAVPNAVLGVIVKRERRKLLENIQYYICLKPDCKTAYFDINGKDFTQNDLVKPIWFKDGAKPKIVCYCNNIINEQVIKAVEESGLKSWKEIVLHYRKKTICQCEKFNPAGWCCTENFYSLINKTLIKNGKPAVAIPKDCCG